MNEQKIRHLEQEKHNANINFNITNKNLEYLRKTKEVLIRNEPKFSNYCKPSPKMQKYKHMSSGVMGFGAAYAGTRLLNALI